MRKLISAAITTLTGLALFGCALNPQGISPVEGFALERYLGRWYEIARLDHSFERGLINVSADYSLREDGGVKVVNRGFDPASGKWRQAEGRAYLTSGPAVGQLKVSFFGPFYGGYNIIELDRKHYQYALICGPSRSYLWILARTPKLEAAVKEQLLSRARELGFDTNRLIFVQQTGI